MGRGKNPLQDIAPKRTTVLLLFLMQCFSQLMQGVLIRWNVSVTSRTEYPKHP